MRSNIILVVFMMMFSGIAQATLAGKNVILVHGFRAGDLSDQPSTQQQAQLARDYFQDFWTSRAEEFLYFSSAERVTGGIKDSIRNQIRAIEQRGVCVNGCVVVTHSTGDLVFRDALTRLGQWGVDRNRFKILSVIDLAGAGGGTELADVATSVAEGGGLGNAALRGVAGAFLGFDVTPNSLGVLRDLRPGTARSIGTSRQGVPRLRFVGTGIEIAGITKPFILGGDDSVVPLHSACGARARAAYDSCSRNVRVNGELRSSNGPSSLLADHFVVLMGEKVGHGNHISNRADGNITTVVNDRTIGGLRLDFATNTRARWWSFFRKVRLLNNGNRKSMSAHIFDTLNR